MEITDIYVIKCVQQGEVRGKKDEEHFKKHTN